MILQKLGSEHARKKLFWAMVVIIASLFVISIPLVMTSYTNYKKAQQAFSEILVLQDISELANYISRERAPSNKAMSSQPEELEKNILELKQYRKQVDHQIEKTLFILNYHGFISQSQQLKRDLTQSLNVGRQSVDQYVQTPINQRTAAQFDQAIFNMFAAWDVIDRSSEDFVSISSGKQDTFSNSYAVILLLSDLRDQAGRIASNIISSVSYGIQIPEDKKAASIQNQYQVHYIWRLINTLQAKDWNDSEYLKLNKNVETEFIDTGIPIVQNLIKESDNHQKYSLTGTDLTLAMVDKYKTVVELQAYVLKTSLESVERDYYRAFRQFIFTLIVSVISIFTAIFTLFYARKSVFIPLIEARQQILDLSQQHSEMALDIVGKNKEDGILSLFDAIRKLQAMLQQRDTLEFQLRNIANTDTLTGVSNRLALNEYIQLLELRPERLEQTGLIILDIDDFKKINDTYGHIVGDQVIYFIATKLKENLRSSDLIVRYGGDEFLIVIDHIDVQNAVKIAEKIRSEIHQSGFFVSEINEFITLSISAGVAVGAPSWMALLERADRALLKVKVAGKNAVLD